MKRHTLEHAVLLAGLLIGTASFAGDDVTKCTDPVGHVTLTDQGCTGHEEAVAVVEDGVLVDGPQAVAEVPRTAKPPVQHVTVKPAEMQHDNWVAKQGAAHGLPLDVATMKAAKMHLQANESAALTVRQRMLASLR